VVLCLSTTAAPPSAVRVLRVRVLYGVSLFCDALRLQPVVRMRHGQCHLGRTRPFGHTPTHVVSDARCFSIKSTMQYVVVGSRLSKAVRLLCVLQLFLVIAVHAS
jgi:hypothetical protein